MTPKRRLLVLALLIVPLVACGGPAVPETGPAQPPAPTVISPLTAIMQPTTEAAAPTATAIHPPQAGQTRPTPAPFDPNAVQLELVPVVSGLAAPVHVTHAGDGSGRLFVVEKRGRVRIVADGQLRDRPFLDITPLVGSRGNEQGLLSVAFHPDYASNGLFFVNYTDRNGDTVVARYRVSDDDRDVADPDSASVVLTLDQPARNHNGGLLLFGPDGYLYIGTGDGGGAGDRFGNGQNGQSLLGKMLRLDVDSAQPYAIPPDNPFVGDPAVHDEIWALGLRNPWRYSFDRATGDLYIADVGQNAYEEIDRQPAGSHGGENYGWNIMEGFHCFPATVDCDLTGLTLPIAEYDHPFGCSVTGGSVYRGTRFPQLVGAYLFGDFCSGRIWALSVGAEAGAEPAELLRTRVAISSFGEDEAGELYLTDLEDGILYQITAISRGTSDSRY